MKDDTSTLTKLRASATSYGFDCPQASMLETFENKAQHRPYLIEIVYPEFTSLCPVTGQPDFATIAVKYVPDKLCVESKSLKLYMVAFRNHGGFMETIVNTILDDLWAATSPQWIEVVGKFNARGGTFINVTAEAGQNPLSGSRG